MEQGSGRLALIIMARLIENIISVLLLLILVFGCVTASQPADKEKQSCPQFWYEENNVRHAGGYPPDFHEMFLKPEKWENLRKIIDVYYIRGNTLKNIIRKYGEDFIRDHFVKVLNKDKINIAIDNLSQWENNIRILRKYNANVTHIALQSILSKYSINRRKYAGFESDQEIQKRMKLAVEQVVEIKKAYPDIQVGIIDAMPTKRREYKKPYSMVVSELKKKGYPLDFIHLDCPMDECESGRFSWEGAKEVENFVRLKLGLDFGFICSSSIGGGMKSDREFYKNVMKIPEKYILDRGQPDHIIIMSWFPHPAMALPDNAPEGEFPMTKTALHLFEKFKSVLKK